MHIFRDLWTGQIELQKTFWLYSLMPVLVIGAMHQLYIEPNLAILSNTPSGPWLLAVYLLAAAAVVVFISVSTWRSAAIYTADDTLPMIARVGMLIWLIGLGSAVASTGRAIVGSPYSPSAINHYINTINKRLPKVIDKHTRYERVSFDGKSFTHLYIVSGLDKVKGLRERVIKQKSLLRKKIRGNINCRKLRDLFRVGATLKYRYAEASGKPVLEIEFTPRDCR